MLFKSTKNKSTNKLLNNLDSFESHYNALTTYEYTFYELHGNIKDWKKLLDILLDLYYCANLNKKDIEIERGVIIEEFNMVDNNMDEYMFNILMKDIYDKIPLANPIIGNLKNIKKFTKNSISKFRNKYYSFDNTAFISIGNIKTILIKNYIINRLKNICKNKSLNHKFINNRDNFLPIQNIPNVNFKNIDKSGQIQILFGFHYEGYYIQDYNPIPDLISILLTGGSSSKLFYLLRTNMGVACSISTNYINFEDSSLFTIDCAVDENKVDVVMRRNFRCTY